LQTTLLGLALAFIVALLAALIGPHFVDWNQFRPQFEAEASRVLGAPVRVNGTLDARLLPTPTLHLRSVAVGGANDPRRLSAEKLDVEFSLSAAMRGEWRASELSLEGFALNFGLDRQGRIEGPLSGGHFNLGSLTIDRLNLAGRIGLHDAVSGASLQLDDFKFNGDVRALAGTMRGEGSFNLAGARIPFRVSSGQSIDGKGTRVRFSADRGDRPLFADLDGVLTFDALAPKFEGALTLARVADQSVKPAAASAPPWRMTSRIRASSSSATLEQVEATYGPEDRALRLAGAGDIRFGASPLLHLALSARQLDADRLLNTTAGEPIHLISSLRGLAGELPAVLIPMHIELDAEQIALGGRPIQNVTAELHADKSAWTVKKFEVRAPGVTQVSATGAISGATYSGPVTIESADPGFFWSWLQGRSDINDSAMKPIRARGNMTMAADRVGIEEFSAEFDGGVIAGRVALADLTDGKTRLDAALKADAFNLDNASGVVSALAGPKSNWPDEVKLSLDIDKAMLAGQEIRPVGVEFASGPNTVTLDRLTVGNPKNFSIGGAGSFNRGAGSGKLSLNVNASSLARVGGFLDSFSPMFASRLKAVESTPGDARLQLSVTLDTAQDQANATARAVLDIDAPQLKGSIILNAAPALDAARGIDLAALSRNDVNAEVKFSSEKSSAMMSLLGLDRILSAQQGPAQFEAALTGRMNAPVRVTAKLTGAGVDGDLRGTVDPWADITKANVTLAVRQADPSVVFDLKPSAVTVQALSSRLAMSGAAFTFDDLDATVGGSRVRGRMAFTRGGDTSVDGKIDIDALDLASVTAIALGAVGRGDAEPLGHGLLRGWRGSVVFQALKALLPGGSEFRLFGGKLDSDGQSLTVDGKGNLGGGAVKANADARLTSDGTAVNLRVNATDADSAALRYRGLAMPEGKASFQVSLASKGRSASALSGALSGAGAVTLNDARIAGLDPRAFESAVRASDDGRATDDASLLAVVEPALAGGVLSVQAAQIPFAIKDGRFRIEPTVLEAPRTRATVSGGYDPAADQMDARVVLSAAVLKPATRRPEIRIDLNGSPYRPVRSIDLASLSSWLAMRSIDRQTQKLDQFERGVSIGSEPEPMSLDEELPHVEPIPKAEVRIPNRDPRRRNSNPKAVATGNTVPPPSNQTPPAPAKPPKPRPPVVLTPPVSNSSSF
jgi:large subunit ribosomal protein L24